MGEINRYDNGDMVFCNVESSQQMLGKHFSILPKKFTAKQIVIKVNENSLLIKIDDEEKQIYKITKKAILDTIYGKQLVGFSALLYPYGKSVSDSMDVYKIINLQYEFFTLLWFGDHAVQTTTGKCVKF